MASIQDYSDLLQEKRTFAHLATTMPDGAPQVTPVWIDYRDGRVLVNTAKGRVKTRNMHLGSPVALSITDPDNPYRYVQVRGVVSKIHDEGADAHIDFLAKKYLDKDKYPFRQPGEERVIYEIEPQRVQGVA
ncbi:PPOX class F420-dependent oxidoreductase [Phenylobacterium sp. LjRoot219]|uniref:PPOX class F420-dependent oxidoreductase n=1 Tax=Phenylobacterium sp. LjRoot219 TaxID=3342283 RepID=UPI003ED06112